MKRPKDLNAPCPWNMRIWDAEKQEWLGESDSDGTLFYGFDIRGGEITCFTDMNWLYSGFAHGRKFIWERSTGLADKNGVEIYENDVLKWRLGNKDNIMVVRWHQAECCFELHFLKGCFGDSLLTDDRVSEYEVIGTARECVF